MKFAKSMLGLALAASAGLAAAQGEIRIAHIYDKTGPLEAYAKQSHTGLMMGLEYLTGGKMEVLGRKIVVIEKDAQLKPDIGKAHARRRLRRRQGRPRDRPGRLRRGARHAAGRRGVQEDPARRAGGRRPITGDKWNRYIFRTARNSTQDAVAGAAALPRRGRRSPRSRRTTRSAATASRPSRRRSPPSAARRRSCTRSTRRSRPPTSPRRRSASSTR